MGNLRVGERVLDRGVDAFYFLVHRRRYRRAGAGFQRYAAHIEGAHRNDSIRRAARDYLQRCYVALVKLPLPDIPSGAGERLPRKGRPRRAEYIITADIHGNEQFRAASMRDRSDMEEGGLLRRICKQALKAGAS